MYLSVSSECCAALVFSLMWTHLCSNKHIISSSRRTRPRLLSSTQDSSSTFYLSLHDYKKICILTLLFSPQEYQIDIIFAQTWVDTRLRYNSSSMRILTLNRYSGFIEDIPKIHIQYHFKFPNMSEASIFVVTAVSLSPLPLQQLLCLNISYCAYLI